MMAYEEQLKGAMETELPYVSVLISSFNGEMYIEDQIQTALEQKGVRVGLMIRDDGSSDRTVDIIKKYSNYGHVNLLPSTGNIGVARSFFELLRNAPDAADFFSFADQDDVWGEEKLLRATQMLRKHKGPTVYFARQEIVDANLIFLRYSNIPRKIGFGNALLECITPGCTMVLNRSARELLLANTPNTFYMMHDWWIYLVLSCFGDVIYDSTSTMKYRQHRKNVVGGSVSLYRTFKLRWNRFRTYGRLVGSKAYPSQQVAEFYDVFKHMLSGEGLILTRRFIDAKKSVIYRLRMAFSASIWRQSYIDDLIVRLLIIVNKY